MLRDIASCTAGALVVGSLLLPSCTSADGSTKPNIMTAGLVVEKMSPTQLFTFVAGIVEGLAHARSGGRPPSEGRACIYRWFYEGENTMARIEATLAHFGDHMPGAVVAAMAEKRCPP